VMKVPGSVPRGVLLNPERAALSTSSLIECRKDSLENKADGNSRQKMELGDWVETVVEV
jgi:hypothetical protein